MGRVSAIQRPGGRHLGNGIRLSRRGPDVPVWFDRAEYALLHRPEYGGAAAASPATSFALPGTTTRSGLRRVYVSARGPTKTSALAVMPLGDWLVTVRLSSVDLEPAALDARLSALLGEIGWPTAPSDARPAPEAHVVAPCPADLAFTKAKLRKADMSQALLGSLLAGAAAAPPPADKAQPRTSWCREGSANAQYGVYRPEGTSDGYMLALGDSGRSAGVFRGLAIPTLPRTGGFGTTLNDVDGSAATYPAFDGLPEPQLVMRLLANGRPVSRTTVRGKKVDITLDSKLAR